MLLHTKCSGMQRIAAECRGMQRNALECSDKDANVQPWGRCLGGLQRNAADCGGLQRMQRIVAECSGMEIARLIGHVSLVKKVHMDQEKKKDALIVLV